MSINYLNTSGSPAQAESLKLLLSRNLLSFSKKNDVDRESLFNLNLSLVIQIKLKYSL